MGSFGRGSCGSNAAKSAVYAITAGGHLAGGHLKRSGIIGLVLWTLASAAPKSAAAEAETAAENIYLTKANIDSYQQKGSGKALLQAPADTRIRRYIVSDSLTVDSLELSHAGLSLIVDTKRAARGANPAIVGKHLRIEKGSLTITAAAPQAAEPIKPNADADANAKAPLQNEENGFPALQFEDAADAPPSSFEQTGGTAAIRAQNGATAIEGSNFYRIEGGAFRVNSQDRATGLRLFYTDLNTGKRDGAKAFFSQSGGETEFAAKGGSTAFDSNQSAEISGGVMHISASENASALILSESDTEFRQSGGEIYIKADDKSTGLQTAQLHITNGKLSLQSGGAGKAVHLVGKAQEGASPQEPETMEAESGESGGRFIMQGGALFIGQNSGAPGGYAIYGEKDSRAQFAAGSILEPVLNADAKGAPLTGLMSFGAARIDDGAKIVPVVKNTAGIVMAAPLSLNFLESREAPIDGSFTDAGSGEKLFFTYKAEKSADGKFYRLRLTPKQKQEENGAAEDKNTTEGGKADAGGKAKPGDKNTGGGDADGGAKDGAGGDAHHGAGGNGAAGGGANLPPQTKLPRPSLRVSDIAQGNNRRAAKALETMLQNGKAAGQENSAFAAANQLYDALYNSNIGDEAQIKRRLRGLSPHQATRLPALSLNAQTRFSEEFRRHILSLYNPAEMGAESVFEGADNRQIWAAPMGGHARYQRQTEDFDTLTANYGGMNFGAAARLDDKALGLAGGFAFGNLKGAENYHASMRHFFIGGAYARALQITDDFYPVLDIEASCGSSRYKQHRRDSFGSPAYAPVWQNSFLGGAAFSQAFEYNDGGLSLVPQIGLDYAYIRQNSFNERGNVLPLRVGSADYNSLEPKLGGALFWRAAAPLSLRAYGFYRYAALERNITLRTELRQMAGAIWAVKGEKINRSAANLGLKMLYQLRQNISFSGIYDVLLQEKRIEQEFSAQAKMAF